MDLMFWGIGLIVVGVIITIVLIVARLAGDDLD